MSIFAQNLIAWQKCHGRNDLPWQVKDPYVRWLSEVMLQQTQVTTVLGYFDRFIKRFPTIESLASAHEDEVMQYWAGLGYYSRARNLHRCAKEIVEHHQGQFPQSREALEALPGIGRSTAAAIVAFAFDARETILDGNVKRVLARYLAVEGAPNQTAVTKVLWNQAQALVPDGEMTAYIQGLMDLGALICTRTPQCDRCPVAEHCQARLQGRQLELPTPNPKKNRPQRTRTFLILWQEDRVWVEKRLQKGVWQGLYCLPEFEGELDEELAEQQAVQLGFDVRNAKVLPSLIHDFSHYRLVMNPIAVNIKKAPMSDENHLFIEADHRAQVGLPTPIETILSNFFGS